MLKQKSLKSTKTRSLGLATLVAAGFLGGTIAPAHAYAVAPSSSVTQVQTTNTTNSNQWRTAYVSPSRTHAATPTTTSPAPLAGAPINAKTTTIDTSKLNQTRAQIVKTALDGQGGKYVWGGKTYKNWDCSGFASYVYKQAGINITPYTYTMKNELKKTNNPQPGDIVFTNKYAHVGIYLGNGKMISALNPAQGTIVTDVNGGGYMPVDGYYTAF